MGIMCFCVCDVRSVTVYLEHIGEQAGLAAASGAALETVERDAREALLQAGFSHVDYVAVRRADDLAGFEAGRVDAPGRILTAAWLGRTRLIDNMAVTPPA